MSILYGPVPSWRLGRSLGIDLLFGRRKTCSFNCVYCQLGPEVYPCTDRQHFVSLDRLREESLDLQVPGLDYATFSGTGEPTLAANLGGAITLVREMLDCPIAVLTNASLMTRADVRQDLSRADLVVAKVDAPDEEIFEEINRPFVKTTLEEILQGIRRFRQEATSRLALQMMFVDANRRRAADMASIARSIQPDEVQLNTPLRPSPVPPLPLATMVKIEEVFAEIPTFQVYRAIRPSVDPLNPEETRRRRPVD